MIAIQFLEDLGRHVTNKPNQPKPNLYPLKTMQVGESFEVDAYRANGLGTSAKRYGIKIKRCKQANGMVRVERIA